MQNDVTYLGKVIKVDSSTVEVEVSGEIPSSSLIIKGKVYKLGQIGTFVKIIAGNISTYGLVESVSNVASNIDDDMLLKNGNSRFLTVHLIGEKVGNRRFEKGIGLSKEIRDILDKAEQKVTKLTKEAVPKEEIFDNPEE